MLVNNFFYSLIGKIFKTKECASLHFQISGSLFPFSVLLICLISKLSYVASHIYNRDLEDLNRFSTRRICSREQRKKQLDWLATNTDDITSQSNSLFSLVRANNFAWWKTGFKTAIRKSPPPPTHTHTHTGRICSWKNFITFQR